MPPLTRGVRLQDRFELTERIGLGGMSEVWRATDTILGRTVAVKVLSSPVAADPVLHAATWREARAAARLAHPNVTQVYDYGEASLPGGTVPYLVMELVEGRSLAERLTAGPLLWPEAAAIGAQVAAALAAAHRLGVVHRDIKPGNVMLGRGGAKVLDFGVAALAGAGGDTGWLVGTPAYAAPEALYPGPVSPAGDVYALGALLYEMLTGRPPVVARTWADAEAAHRAGASIPALDVPGLPRAVDRLVQRCLSMDPAERPTAEVAAVALASASGLPDPTETLPPVDPDDRPAEANYAVGSAALPHPPTMVEPAPAYEPAEPARLNPLLLLGVVAATATLVIAAMLVVAALRPAGDRDGTGAAPGPTTAATSGAPTTTGAAPQSREEIVTAFEALLDTADIDGDDDEELRHKLDDLRDARGQGNKVRDAARELVDKLEEFMEEGRIDTATGEQLIALLQPLTGGRDGNG